MHLDYYSSVHDVQYRASKEDPNNKGMQYHIQGGHFTIAHTEGLAGFAAGAGGVGGGAAPGRLRMVYIQYIHTYIQHQRSVYMVLLNDSD